MVKMRRMNLDSYLEVFDEEHSHDEAEHQWTQHHGVTELQQPHTQQTHDLDQVQRGRLHTYTMRVGM